MRLIDAEALLDNIPKEWTIMDVGRVVTAPTVEAVPVVHAHWYIRPFETFYRCSKCGDIEQFRSAFCPRCGARMDEKERNKNESKR